MGLYIIVKQTVIFQKIFKSDNKIDLWEFLLQKSMEYNDITPPSLICVVEIRLTIILIIISFSLL